MRKQLLTIAAAAAMACSSIAFAADETNRAARKANENPAAPQGGQTGAAKTDATAGASTDSRLTSDNRASGATDNRSTDTTTTENRSAGSRSTGASASGGATSTDMTTTGGTSANAARATGTASGDMAHASASATGESDIQQALSSAGDGDKLFLVCAAIDNNCEIQLAQLAQQKAQDQQVKQFAQQMLKDHQQAQRQVEEAAQQTGVKLPRSLPATKQQEMRVLQSLSGKDFDQQYISKMRAGHAKAVSEYTDVSKLAKNDQVKKYAQETLPTLQKHYQHVEQTATALGLPSMSDAQPAGARMHGESPHGSGTSGNRSNP